MAWTTLSFSFGSLLTSAKMTQMYDNFQAMGDGDSGAPSVSEAAIASSAVTEGKIGNSAVTENKIGNSAVTENKIGNSAVTENKIGNNAVTAVKISNGEVGQSEVATGAIHQAELDTSTGEVQHSSTGWADYTLPGGEYGFFPQVDHDITGTDDVEAVIWNSGVGALPGVPATRVCLYRNDGADKEIECHQRYINSSPPFDLGDGEIKSFIFLWVRGGDIAGIYFAPAPPWAYNGRTNIGGKQQKDGRKVQTMQEIKAELFDEGLTTKQAVAVGRITERELINRLASDNMVERVVDHNVKNADMIEIPHPFGSAVGADTVVLLDPASQVMERLNSMQQEREFRIGDIKRYMNIGNQELSRNLPPGVVSYSLNWKQTN